MVEWKDFPTTFDDFQKELLIHSKDGRSDPGFRLNIALSQMGNLASHFTHDQKENPIARPYGTKASEVSDAGHAIVQLCTYIALRKIDLQDAINAALPNLREKDFIKRVPRSCGDIIIGHTGCAGSYIGMAHVDEQMTIKPPYGNMVLISSHPKSDARLKKFGAIVTNEGSIGCHAAIIARECGIPCVVGTGDATKRIPNLAMVEVIATKDGATVKIL